jgi:3-oxoacyl-[acyl-carrier protein] reductase
LTIFMPTAYVALGSNLGDRRGHLERAVELLVQRGVSVEQISSYHETAPVGGPAGQGNYLNAAARIATSLDPPALLQLLLDIESELGRVRSEKNAPRTVDLDLLLYGDSVIEERGRKSRVLVPHPRLQDRRFVLAPLTEIAANVVHPVFQQTIAQLLEVLKIREGREETRSAGRELAGMRALVTGSTSGIGRAIALELAAGGADVLIHGRRSRDRAGDVAKTCVAAGVRADIMMADLRDAAARRQLAEIAWRHWNGLDILVCNAGADTLTGAAARWPFEKKLAELWAIDVEATVALARALGQRMQDRGTGVILTMGWDQASAGMEGDSGQLFGTTKAAVMAFSASLAKTLAPEVRVNCLAPGWIKTAWGETASQAWQDRARREAPLARWGTPDDVAQAARWLASPAASFITGQVLRVNGGAVRG